MDIYHLASYIRLYKLFQPVIPIRIKREAGRITHVPYGIETMVQQRIDICLCANNSDKVATLLNSYKPVVFYTIV